MPPPAPKGGKSPAGNFGKIINPESSLSELKSEKNLEETENISALKDESEKTPKTPSAKEHD